MRGCANIMLFFVIALGSLGASAATFTVTNTNDSGAGSLRAQIAAAGSAAGTDLIDFSVSGTITLVTELAIDFQSVSIVGPTGSPGITISGNNAVRCFHIGNTGAASGTTISLSNLALLNGRAGAISNYGGGIRVASANIALTMTNVSFTGCQTVSNASGGGIRFDFVGAVTMSGCSFTNCSCTGTGTGGAFDVQPPTGGAFNISNCTFTNNSAPGGAGAVTPSSTSTIFTNCTFTGNNTPGAGGAMFCGAAPVVLDSCTFSGNTAALFGGGAHLAGNSYTVTSCTFSGNTATTGYGGGLSVHASGPAGVVRNSTFSGNTADMGGGAAVVVQVAGPGTVDFTNCTFSANMATGASGGGGLLAGGYIVGSQGIANLTNCTFALNVSTTATTGTTIVAYTQNAGATGQVIYKNTIISGAGIANIGTSGSGTLSLTSNNNNLCSDGTGNLTGLEDLPNTPANLGALAANGGPTQTHMPNFGSAAIDKGRLIVGVTTDQRGTARPIDDPTTTNANGGDGSDIGAIEAPLPPEIAIVRGTTTVSDGGSDYLGKPPVGVPTVFTYTVSNSGPSALSITTPVLIAGQTNCTATVTTQPATSVAAAGSTTLDITVTPTASGAFSFTVSITNNDPNENPYNWTVQSGSAGKSGGNDSGGGCSTSGSPDGLAFAALMFGALGLLWFRRRIA